MKSSWTFERNKWLFIIVLLTVFAVVLGWAAHAVFGSNEQSHLMQLYGTREIQGPWA